MTIRTLIRTMAPGITAALALALMGTAYAATTTATGAMNVTVNAAGKLSITGGSGTYSADLSVTSIDPSVTSLNFAALTFTCKVHLSKAKSATLTVLAGGDLTDGVDTAIPIADLTWAGTGNLAATGTMSLTAVTMDNGSWSTSGTYSGSVTYSIALPATVASNAAPYTTTLTYTLATL